jgi:hypothetical protein
MKEILLTRTAVASLTIAGHTEWTPHDAEILRKANEAGKIEAALLPTLTAQDQDILRRVYSSFAILDGFTSAHDIHDFVMFAEPAYWRQRKEIQNSIEWIGK